MEYKVFQGSFCCRVSSIPSEEVSCLQCQLLLCHHLFEWGSPHFTARLKLHHLIHHLILVWITSEVRTIESIHIIEQQVTHPSCYCYCFGCYVQDWKHSVFARLLTCTVIGWTSVLRHGERKKIGKGYTYINLEKKMDPDYFTLYCITLYYIILHYIILYYIILHYITLYILYILYYIII